VELVTGTEPNTLIFASFVQLAPEFHVVMAQAQSVSRHLLPFPVWGLKEVHVLQVVLVLW
jgi:hypothetical protein